MTAPPTTSTPPEVGGLTVEAGADLLALLPDSPPPPKSPEPPATDAVPVVPEPLDVPEVGDGAPAAPELYDVKIDGVTEKVPLEEALKGYQRRADYDRNRNKLSQERKEFEQQRAKELAETKAARDQYAARLQRMDAALDDLGAQEPDFDKIRTESPELFAQAVAEWSLVKEKRAKITAERQRVADEQRREWAEQEQARVATEQERLGELIPELKDPSKAPALREALFAEGAHRGFTREEVALTKDARLVAMLNDARLYRELLAKRDALRVPQKDAPKTAPVLQPGTRSAPLPKGRKEAQAAFGVFKKSGSIQDAARVLEALDLD